MVHIHEPVAPLVGWLAADWTRLPLVGTFHSYSNKRLPNGLANPFGARRVLNHLHVRIAVSEAAAWTGRRWFGGHYKVIPNGVHVDRERAERAADRPTGETLQIVFVGQAVERKGLPLLLRAFEALREHIPTELVVVGPTEEELAPMLIDPRGVKALGKVSDERKQQVLEQADVLCAPSLGGESFGMVLTEAFAAGTPVIASDIPGYRDVVRDGVDGMLIAPGDALALAESLRDLYEEPERRRQMALAAARDVERFAWPRVATEVLEAYEEAIAVPEPDRALHRAAVRVGARAADLKPHVPAARLPSLERAPVTLGPQRPALAFLRRAAVPAISLVGLVLAYFAIKKIGLGSIASALTNSSPTFVLLGLAIMCSSMVLRAFSWHAILRAALPRARIRLSDAMQGTFIGVLMSSTLPARLGEPSRALVVARRTGRPREDLPVVLGTLVSQTLLNLLALAILGAIMFSSVNIFSGHQEALLIAAIAPLTLLLIVLVAPLLLRRRGSRRIALGPAAQRRGPGAGGAVPGAQRPGGVPPAKARAPGERRSALCLGAAVALLLHAAGRARPRAPDRNRGRGRGAVRGEHHRGAAGDAGEPRRVPAGVRGGASHRLARQLRRRRRLRRDPAGRGGRNRSADGDAGAAEGGHVLAGDPPARDARHPGEVACTPRTGNFQAWPRHANRNRWPISLTS